MTVFRGYCEELCTLGEIERRVDAMEAKAMQQRRDAGLPDTFSKDKQWARRLLRDSLLDHRALNLERACNSVQGATATVARRNRGNMESVTY